MNPSRRTSRHRAVQVLYQCDMRSLQPDQAISAFYESLYSEENEAVPDKDQYMETLVFGTSQAKAGIDDRIRKYSERWRLERMPIVDRNIMRLAIHEMDLGDTPPVVVIDEALELARKFSGPDSIPFINGVLDAARKDLEKK